VLVRSAARGSQSGQRGVTVIELMVTLAIGAVVLGLAVPGLQESAVRTRLDSAAQEFFTSAQFARSEAIRLGEEVTLRRNAMTASGNWENGWTIFVDANGNGVLDAGEQVIRDGAPLMAPLSLNASAGVSDFLTFNRDGRPTRGGGAFVLCHGPSLTEGAQPRSRAVLINGAGNVRMAQDTDKDGVPETDAGPASSCRNP